MKYAGLTEAVAQLRYKEGWQFRLRTGLTSGSAFTYAQFDGCVPAADNSGSVMIIPDDEMVTLVITLHTANSDDPEQMITVPHTFSAPYVGFGGDWDRWILQCIMAVETHEAREAFWVGDRRPFYPPHGSEGDPYGPW